jgi:hypothetical protein
MEFQRIARRAKVGKRIADKLCKVWLGDGHERWLLIHVEIQGDYEKQFPARMFEYHTAARRLNNQEVVNLAVLCDDNAAWRPTKFAYERWGCGVAFKFRTVKLLDWLDRTEFLEPGSNPFSTVVHARLEAMRTRKNPEARGQAKLRIVKGLYRHGWSKEEVRLLFGLVDGMLALPNEQSCRFAKTCEVPQEGKVPR